MQSVLVGSYSGAWNCTTATEGDAVYYGLNIGRVLVDESASGSAPGLCLRRSITGSHSFLANSTHTIVEPDADSSICVYMDSEGFNGRPGSSGIPRCRCHRLYNHTSGAPKLVHRVPTHHAALIILIYFHHKHLSSAMSGIVLQRIPPASSAINSPAIVRARKRNGK